MSQLVCNGAKLKCQYGAGISSLIITPNMVSAGQSVATMMDCMPMKNILPFGICNSPLNPMFKPNLPPPPCIPMPKGQWLKASQKVKVHGIPALTGKSELMCYGKIMIISPGQTKVSANG